MRLYRVVMRYSIFHSCYVFLHIYIIDKICVGGEVFDSPSQLWCVKKKNLFFFLCDNRTGSFIHPNERVYRVVSPIGIWSNKDRIDHF